jgi:hypothetical protein
MFNHFLDIGHNISPIIINKERLERQMPRLWRAKDIYNDKDLSAGSSDDDSQKSESFDDHFKPGEMVKVKSVPGRG